MKAAIYARYSSENQSEKSIDDQVRVCKKYADSNEMTIEDKHIYVDEAISGSVIKRPGLQAIEKAAENKEIDVVIVDDLSRLSRSNHQMLTLVLRFNYYQVKIASVSDGIITDDDNAKLGIHVRGLINELYLDDLKKKTMRGLEGQKLRGFSAGEAVYGYKTHPVGELRLNKKGHPKYDGMVHKINPEEADVVKRIYAEFMGGKSISKIVASLNEDKISTKRGYSGGWNTSSVSRILKNERYIGKWTWRQSKNVRDPMTGKIKKFARPKKEQLFKYREDLIIIDHDTWEKTQKRWKSLEGSYPIRKNAKSSIKQKSYIHSNPTHLLAGLMRCKSCGGAIVQMSGKGGGYYGCYNTKRKTCNNKLLVSRKRVEIAIISELKERLLTVENLEYVYKNVEKLVQKGLNEVPDVLKKKRAQYDKLLLEIQNYLNFIKAGNFSKAVSDALGETETKTNNLKAEIGSLEFQRGNSFQSPPKEWINHRLDKLNETLSKNTTASALALKELLGPIQMEAISERDEDDYLLEIASLAAYNKDCGARDFLRSSSDTTAPRNDGEGRFKPYYVAHTKIRTLALLDDRYKGANWYHWRRR